MANIRQLNEESGQVFYPQTHEKAVIDSNGNTLDTKIASTLKYTEQSLTAAQQGQARINIGAASQADLENVQKEEYVTVATLADRPAASASTLGKIYMVGPNANNQYDKYYTSFDGTAYSWVSAGTTEIALTTYAKQSDLDQLGQEVTDLIPTVFEDGFYIIDSDRNIGFYVDENGIAALIMSVLSTLFTTTNEDGFYIIDSDRNIGFMVNANGAHSANLVEY